MRNKICHTSWPRSVVHHIQSLGLLIGARYHIRPETGVAFTYVPKIVIPMHYAVDGGSTDLQGPEKFLNEMAVTEPLRQPKAQVTSSSLPDETQVVLLEARGRTS